ncbi:MAG TPA: DUF389 domain-containing protein [Acidimicrobiales bacterium]|nr:DUF389 domain-containing protein [Acidimicrobiales bacterium]
MVHLRLIVPSALTARVVEHLRAAPGVAHVVHVPVVTATPPGDLVLCDVVREAANGVIEWLQDLDIHCQGAIMVEALEAVVSDAAARAEARAPGSGADALVWEELDDRVRADSRLSASFLVFMAVSAIIAGVGILLDAPILIVGAMVVGPEYGPLSALCIAAVRRRASPVAAAAATLAVGLATAAGAALVATVAFRLTGLAPGRYDLSDRQLTAFISHPDGLAAVVAVLAGIIGMLSITQARSGALIGVLVSVTTIPAVANVGVATAYREWAEVGGAALQLVVNVIGLTVAGIVTLAVQGRATHALPSSGTAGPPR